MLKSATYSAVSDVQEDLLSLLRTTDDVREAGGLLRCHPVMWKAALKSSSFQTCKKSYFSFQLNATVKV